MHVLAQYDALPPGQYAANCNRMTVQVPHDNPAQALLLAEQVTIAVYEGARKLGGDLGPVLVPPRCIPFSCIDQET